MSATMKRKDPLELLTIDEASRLIKRSRRSLHQDIAAGELRAVKLGTSTRIPRVEIERYLAERGFPTGHLNGD